MMKKLTFHKILSTIISLPVIVAVIILMYIKPDWSFVGINIVIFSGTILIILFFAKLWKHEIERMDGVFTKIQYDLKLKDHFTKREIREMEHYHLLQDTRDSLRALKSSPNLMENHIEIKKKRRSLFIQSTFHTVKLFFIGILWSLRLILPLHFDHQPTILESWKICLEKPRFHILRFILLLWLLALISITATYIYIQ